MSQFQPGIQLHTGFIPLAFLFYFCSPVVVIDDGVPLKKRWGSTFIPLLPGRHRLKVYVPYLFWPECGANEIELEIPDGGVARVRFFMPPWVFAKGSLTLTP